MYLYVEYDEKEAGRGPHDPGFPVTKPLPCFARFIPALFAPPSLPLLCTYIRTISFHIRAPLPAACNAWHDDSQNPVAVSRG